MKTGFSSFFQIWVPQNRSFLCYMISIYHIIILYVFFNHVYSMHIDSFLDLSTDLVFDPPFLKTLQFLIDRFRCMFVCVTAATTDRSSVILCNLCGHAYYIHISPPHIYREKPPENVVFESEET